MTTTIPKSALERAIIGTMWSILLLYIGWSSLRIMDNSRDLAVIEERTHAILLRMDKAELLREALEKTKDSCLSRYKDMITQVEEIRRHVATDSAWGKQIDERIRDLQERVRALEKGGRK